MVAAALKDAARRFAVALRPILDRGSHHGPGGFSGRDEETARGQPNKET